MNEKMKKIIAATAVAAGVVVATGASCFLIDASYDKKLEQSNADNIVKAGVMDSGQDDMSVISNWFLKEKSLSPDKPGTENEAIDSKALVNSLESQKIKVFYCKELDEYYTEDGRDIAELSITTTYESYADIEKKVLENGQVVFSCPTGYVLDGNRAVKRIKSKETKFVDVAANGDYSKYLDENAKGSSYEVVIHKTQTFDKIIDLRFVYEVKDEKFDEATGKFYNQELNVYKK